MSRVNYWGWSKAALIVTIWQLKDKLEEYE
jgi:hypothetical protein